MSRYIQTELDRLMSRTVIEIIHEEFSQCMEGDRPSFRIKNLSMNEISDLLDVWEAKANGTKIEGVRVVVSGDATTLPERFRADPDRSITYYRNNNLNGLVYIETKVESDEQGLKNLYTLRDGNFLNGDFDRESARVPELMIGQAWSVIDGGERPPEILKTRLIEVLDFVHGRVISISVRKFARFLLEALYQYKLVGNAMSADEINSLVGECLIELDMFPDQMWHLDGRDARIESRLKMNILHADLVKQGNVEIDTDKLVEQIEKFRFMDEDGEEYTPSDQKEWRQRCRLYVNAPSLGGRKKIPYRIFEQLFTDQHKGIPLGERILLEIQEVASSRVGEYESLCVQAGLDKRDSDDAVRFLDAEPDPSEELSALRDLIQPQTRKKVEKIAYPAPEIFNNPLLKLAGIVNQICSLELPEDEDYILKVVPSEGFDIPVYTRGLFAFIFGKSLSNVQEASMDGSIFRLDVDDLLLEITKPEMVETEESDESPVEIWGGLHVDFHLVSDKSGKEEIIESETNLIWSPDDPVWMAMVWILLQHESGLADYPHFLSPPEDRTVEEWIGHVTLRHAEVSTGKGKDLSKSLLSDGVIAGLTNIRKVFREEVSSSGIDAESLSDYFDDWQLILTDAKSAFLPDGKRDERLESFIGCDFLIGAGEKVIMLPVHPFKLRWFGRFLSESEKLAIQSLEGKTLFNRANPTKYLSWMESLSSHQQPPLASTNGGECVFASTEIGLAEEYTPIGLSQNTAVGSSVDRQSLEEIANQVTTYLHAHPYKSDGLSLLIVLSRMAAFPAELVALIRSRNKGISISLNVVAPRDLWEEIARGVEKLPGSDRMSMGDMLFPLLQLRMHEMIQESLSETLMSIESDLAVIPQFVSDDIKVKENTDADSSQKGRFDPLLDNPVAVYGGIDGSAIRVSMRPKHADQPMDDWSSLIVRNYRNSPVSVSQPENTDYLELVIDFQQTAEVFEALHQSAHWVITLERYIQREQIESLESRPDILTMVENVGSNGLYTLVVSSNTGQKFIVDRLVRKIARIAPTNLEREKVERLAESMYQETRTISPRLALQALGISRVTEEIMGLVVARRVATEQFPVSPSNGLVAWISLDDHQDWFSGQTASRADLCRITLDKKDDVLHVDVLAVEGKFRQIFDPHGVDQVSVTMSLLSGALGDASRDFIDARLWRELILIAMESASPEARIEYGLPAGHVQNGRYKLQEDVRDMFREGEFVVDSFEGIYSICLYDHEGEAESQYQEDSDVHVVRTYREKLMDIFGWKSTSVKKEKSSGAAGNNPEVIDPPDDGSSGGDNLENGRPLEELLVDEDSSVQSARNKLSNEVLTSRYQVVLDTYANFGVSVRKPERESDYFVEGPASVIYRVKPNDGVPTKKIVERKDDLKLKLALSEEQQIRFGNNRGNMEIDVPKSVEDRYFVSADDLWNIWKRPPADLATPLGEDVFGNLVEINFSSSNSPHLLIGGTTGSGKSEALNTILYGLARYYSPEELRLLLVDPKGTELQDFERDEHLEGQIGWDEMDATALLEKAVAEMQRRYQQFKQHRTRTLMEYNEQADERMPWWLVVLDEYADLTSDPEAKKGIEALLKRLAQKARAAGIHVIIATQKPSAEVISTNLRSNLPAQLALRVKSSNESRVVMDDQGAETLNGMGDALLKMSGKIVRIQCAKV